MVHEKGRDRTVAAVFLGRLEGRVVAREPVQWHVGGAGRRAGLGRPTDAFGSGARPGAVNGFVLVQTAAGLGEKKSV